MPVGTCVRCDQTIMRAVNLLEYKGMSFHTNCFTCSICTNNIAGPKGFINDPVDQLKQYCHECYSRDVAPKCSKCEEAIVGPEGGVRHRGNPFHRNCFLCHGCGQSLAERRFSVQNGSPYCPECFVDKFAERCSMGSCGKPIAPGTEYLMVDQSDEGKDPLKFHKGSQYNTFCGHVRDSELTCNLKVGYHRFRPNSPSIMGPSVHKGGVAKYFRAIAMKLIASNVPSATRV